MTIAQLFKKIVPFAKPYRNLITYTFALTLIGSFAAQVNAFILKYTVDTISDLLVDQRPLSQGFYLLGIIAAILLGKDILYLQIISPDLFFLPTVSDFPF